MRRAVYFVQLWIYDSKNNATNCFDYCSQKPLLAALVPYFSKEIYAVLQLRPYFLQIEYFISVIKFSISPFLQILTRQHNSTPKSSQEEI